MEARRGRGRRRQRSPCGVLPRGAGRPFKQAQEGGDPESKQGTEAPRALRVVNRCLLYDSARPLSGQGRGQTFAKGLSPRRLRPETSLPGFQRIPRTASTSSVPAVAGGHQGGSPARALAVDQAVSVPEPSPHQVRPLGVGPPNLMRLSLRRVHAGEDCQRTVNVPRLPEPPRLVDALGHAQRLRRRLRRRFLLQAPP